jgi:MoaA/NifB/PqqE/SkfB family radical SAM enzyme
VSDVPASTTVARALRSDDLDRPRPLYVVWGITMRCAQPCQHCGSRSGKARPSELTTEELFEVGRGLARLGAREVTLIGGEAYLREDCEALIRFLADLGMRVTMQTGGRAFTPELARRFRDAGLDGFGVSIDGPARAHDRLRGNLGSHQQAVRALEAARDAGFAIGANTQINKLNCDHLRETAKLLRERGVETWQVQLTGPMGCAADHPEWIIDPWQIVPIIDTLAALQLEAMREFDGVGRPFNVFANNKIGYFGPHEQVIRSRPFGRENHWRGCQAGVFALGIESDGTVKACPTLPTAPYQGGNVRTLTIEQLWERSEALAFARERTADELWGFCKT